MQEVDFPIEILINDDASTDRTPEILREYEKQYPGVIRVVYQTTNQYSKGIRPVSNILMPMARGKYIALCEGDDYWTDPNKLVTQVAYLESNSDYVMSAHAAVMQYVSSDAKSYSTHSLRDGSRSDLLRNRVFYKPATWVFRNILGELPAEMKFVPNGDMFLMCLLGHFGAAKYHHDIKPAVFRVHTGGVWSSKPPTTQLDMRIMTRYWQYKYYSRVGDAEMAKYYKRQMVLAAIYRASASDIIYGVAKRVRTSLKRMVAR